MAVRTTPVDVPLAGLKQAADARVVPVEGAAAVENYRVARAAAYQKRAGITGPAFAAGVPVQASPLPLGGHHVLRTDGTCAVTPDLGATIGLPSGEGLSIDRNFAPFAPPEVLVRAAFGGQAVQEPRAQAHAVETQTYRVVTCQVVVRGQHELAASVYTLDGAPLSVGQRLTGDGIHVLLRGGVTDEVIVVAIDTGSNLRATRYQVTPSGLGGVSSATLVVLGGATFSWDAATAPGGNFWVAYDSGGVPGISTLAFNPATLALAGGGGLAGTVRPQAISIGLTSNRMAIASVDRTTNAQRATLVDLATPSVLFTTTTGFTPTIPTSVAACVLDNTATGPTPSAVFMWSSFNDSIAPLTDLTTTRVGLTLGTSGALASQLWVGVRPAAKPFAPTTDRCVAALDVVPQRAPGSAVATSTNPSGTPEPGHGTAIVEVLARTDLVLGIPAVAAAPALLAWHNIARSGVAAAYSRLANPIASADGSYSLCLTALDRAEIRLFVPFQLTYTAALSVRVLVVRYRPLPSAWTTETRPVRPSAPAGACAFLAGAAPALAQGGGVTPAGYLHPPEIMGVRQTVTGTSSVWPDSSVSIRARYLWLDARGNELTSAWSLPSQIATPTAVANTRLDIYVRGPICWTANSLGRWPWVELAIASGTSTTFVRTLAKDLSATSPSSLGLNATTPGIISLGVTADDVGLELVVTNDLANDPPPCASFVFGGRSRWFLVSPEDGVAYFSKPAQFGVLPEWSLAFVLTPTESTGQPVGGAELGDTVVIVGTRGACKYVGDGLDGNGGGTPFAGPYQVAAGHGCISAASICQTPDALFWRTRHTIVMFDGGTAQPVGRDAQGVLDAYPYTLASCYYGAHNAAVWLLADASENRVLLLYDLTHRAWLTWTLGGVSGATDVSSDAGGLYVVGGSRVCRYDEEEAGDGQDLSGYPQGMFRSQSARLSAVNGFQLAQAIVVAYESNDPANTVALRLYLDGKPTPIGPFASPPLGEGVDQVRFNIPPQYQQCSSLAVQIEDAEPADPDESPAGVSILGVTFELGVEPGSPVRPLASARTF